MALRPFRAIRALKITVAVGWVIGTRAAITPMGSARVMMPVVAL